MLPVLDVLTDVHRSVSPVLRLRILILVRSELAKGGHSTSHFDVDVLLLLRALSLLSNVLLFDVGGVG